MADIVEFRLPPPPPLTEEEKLAQLLSPKQAMDLIVLGMLDVAMPQWVELQWPFQFLEMLCDDLRNSIEDDLPPQITRGHVLTVVENLRPSWEFLIKNIDTSYFW